MIKKQIAVIFCPPLSKYPEQPTDISECELVDCPECNNPMWFSEKKKFYKKLSEDSGKDIIFACYICFEKMVNENKDIMNEHTVISI